MNEILSCDTTTWLHGRHPALFKGKVRAIRICRETTRVLLDQHPDHNHTVNANDLLSSEIATAEGKCLVTAALLQSSRKSYDRTVHSIAGIGSIIYGTTLAAFGLCFSRLTQQYVLYLLVPENNRIFAYYCEDLFLFAHSQCEW